MAYFLFLLANFALFVRPGEILPLLAGVPLYQLLIVGALVGAAAPLKRQVTQRMLAAHPATLCVLGVLLAVGLSHLSLMYLYGLRTGVMGMAKVVAYYLLLVSLVNTPRRLRQFLACTALSATVMIAYSVWDYTGFVRQWDGNPALAEAQYHDAHRMEGEPRVLQHVVEINPGAVTETGDAVSMYRMRGLGIFNDPNDVALLIVVTSIISLYFLSDRQLVGLRYLWLAPLALMAAALLCTQSRGGVLAAGCAGMVWLAARYGGRVAISLGILGAVCVPIALGRAGDIELSEGTGQSRIQLWADGLAQLKSPRVLFGIGEGMYEEYAGLVAHNSFVHAFVELGVFGGTMFFGCLFFPAYALWLMDRHRLLVWDSELRRMRPYIAGLLACWCMGLCALSRCYVESTYMIVGVAAVYVSLAGRHQRRPRPIVVFNPFSAQRWLLCSAGLLCGCFVFVRLFAQWNG